MYAIIISLAILLLLLLLNLARWECVYRRDYYEKQFHSKILMFDECGDVCGEHFIYRPHFVMGRQRSKSDVCLLDVYQDPHISRCHAMVWYSNGRFFIKPVVNGAHTGYTDVTVGDKLVPPRGVRLPYNVPFYIKGHCMMLVEHTGEDMT